MHSLPRPLLQSWTFISPLAWNVGKGLLSAELFSMTYPQPNTHPVRWLNNVGVRPRPFPSKESSPKESSGATYRISYLPLLNPTLFTHVDTKNTPQWTFCIQIFSPNLWYQTERKVALQDPDCVVGGHRFNPQTSWLYELIHFPFYWCYFVLASCHFHWKRLDELQHLGYKFQK